MKDPKFVQEIAKVALHNPANSDIYTVEMAKFVATFERVAMPSQFKHLFLVQSTYIQNFNLIDVNYLAILYRNILQIVVFFIDFRTFALYFQDDLFEIITYLLF
jgi:hypothetical protein